MATSTRQARVITGHPVQVSNINQLYAEPTDGFQLGGSPFWPLSANPNTAPLHIMSPRTRQGTDTAGIIIGFDQGLSSPQVTGMGLWLWIADPNGYLWFRSEEVFMNDRDAIVTYDIDASPLYIQVDQTTIVGEGACTFHFLDV